MHMVTLKSCFLIALEKQLTERLASSEGVDIADDEDNDDSIGPPQYQVHACSYCIAYYN